jgi:predicted RNA binding protein YcfA (HicA-like mRNA interferase family)
VGQKPDERRYLSSERELRLGVCFCSRLFNVVPGTTARFSHLDNPSRNHSPPCVAMDPPRRDQLYGYRDDAAAHSGKERRSDFESGTRACPLPASMSQELRTDGSMPPSPRVTGREVITALTRMGWVIAVQRGSHVHLKHPERGGRVTVPVHGSETIGPKLLRSILSQAGVTVEKFRNAL